MSTITTKRVRCWLAALFLPAALAATLAVASPAKAAFYYPGGDVDGVYNGTIYYSTALPVVSGWAADADAPKSPILVRADVTWTKRGPCNTLTCVTYVVGQTSLTQWANLYRHDLLGEVGPNDIPWGPYHGFSFNLPPAPVPVGSWDGEKVCLTAFNTGLGANRSLGCYPLAYGPLL
jgi:hypothetical protein